MKPLFVAVAVVQLVWLFIYLDRKTICKAIIQTQAESGVISTHIKQQLQVLATEMQKGVLPTISREETDIQMQTSLNLVLEIMEQLGIRKPDFDVNVTVAEEEVTRKGELLDVCPEVYLGIKSDFPLFEKSRVLAHCTNARPFPDVLSILLNGFDYITDDEILVVLREIYNSYPKLTVHVAIHKTLAIPGDLKLSVKQHELAESATADIIWNTLAEKATTDFVLVGRRIERFLLQANVELERLVRVVSELGVDAVGGAFRTPDGHWSLGCQQTQLAHYRIKYVDGYHRSSKSCAFCDYIPSPFVSRLSTLRAVRFNMTSPDVVFHDYFLRLKKLRKLAVSCPDVMFFMQGDNMSEASRHKQWKQMAQVHAINVVNFADGKQLSFSCEEAKTLCKRRKGISVPVCCLNVLRKQIQDVFDICEKLGIFCRVDYGTALGAIKFKGVLPWELDADISYTPSNKVNFWQRKDDFTRSGYTIRPFFPTWCPQFNQSVIACRKFAIRSRFWEIDMWDSSPRNITDWLREQHLKPTKVQIGDRWFNSLTNPGLNVRNRYCYEVLKHVEHIAITGLRNLDLMRGGQYIKCPKPGFNGCLDQSDADGNIGIIFS
jgi:hypothetical protein